MIRFINNLEAVIELLEPEAYLTIEHKEQNRICFCVFKDIFSAEEENDCQNSSINLG